MAEKQIGYLDQENHLYWERALAVVNAWSAYNGKKKLYINATHSETAHRVWHIVEKNFNGDVEKIADRRDQLKAELDRNIAIFESTCKKFNLPVISENWCFNHIPDGTAAAKLRGKIERLLAKDGDMKSLNDLL